MSAARGPSYGGGVYSKGGIFGAPQPFSGAAAAERLEWARPGASAAWRSLREEARRCMSVSIYLSAGGTSSRSGACVSWFGGGRASGYAYK